MKKLIILIITVISVTVFGQVGINTENPKQIFHVDGQKDNPPTGNPTEADQLNDVVITENGQIGVGKISPTEKIDVKGNIALSSDGNEASSIKFYENSVNGSNKITVKAPGTFDTDRNITLPSNEPKNGYVLITDASGSTSWGAVNPSLTTLASIALKTIPSPPISTGAVAGENLNFRFFQPFDDVVTDDNGVFDVTTGTYTAPQPGNYLITAYIVPNASPSRNNPNFYYPVNLEVRKNCSGDPNAGEIIMDNSVIRHATPGWGGIRFSVSVNGMVTLDAGETLNLVVYLTGTNALGSASGGISFPVNFSYANVATFKALFSVTAL